VRSVVLHSKRACALDRASQVSAPAPVRVCSICLKVITFCRDGRGSSQHAIHHLNFVKLGGLIRLPGSPLAAKLDSLRRNHHNFRRFPSSARTR
jgi:hypothetical protein